MHACISYATFFAKNYVHVCMYVCSEKTRPFSSEPAVVTVSPWDGKDAILAVDEIPLDELFSD